MSLADRPPGPLLERLIAPRFLLAGTALAFLLCCLAGHLLARKNPFKYFRRFHIGMSLETDYFPTANHVLSLLRERIPPDKVAVIIGGSSVLYGYGQGFDEMWHQRLQEKLGDDFVVINLAMRGARAQEYGAVAAEMFAHQHEKVICMADLGSPGTTLPLPEQFESTYAFFFWDAYTKGLLDRYELRDQAAAAFLHRASETEERQTLMEKDREWRADRYLRFHDLWGYLAYRTCSTIYNRHLGARFLKARRDLVDIDQPPVPADKRYQAKDLETHMFNLRGMAGDVDSAPRYARYSYEAFPPAMRPRMLFLLVRDSPHYVDRLTPEERKNYEAVLTGMASELKKLGLAHTIMGTHYTSDDFMDCFHICASGGYKLAAELAPEIRKHAARLGYLQPADRKRGAAKE